MLWSPEMVAPCTLRAYDCRSRSVVPASKSHARASRSGANTFIHSFFNNTFIADFFITTNVCVDFIKDIDWKAPLHHMGEYLDSSAFPTAHGVEAVPSYLFFGLNQLKNLKRLNLIFPPKLEGAPVKSRFTKMVLASAVGFRPREMAITVRGSSVELAEYLISNWSLYEPPKVIK